MTVLRELVACPKCSRRTRQGNYVLKDAVQMVEPLFDGSCPWCGTKVAPSARTVRAEARKTVKCGWCDVRFEPKGKHHVYCKPACNKRADRDEYLTLCERYGEQKQPLRKFYGHLASLRLREAAAA